jgi:hypothetical protein
MCEYSHNMGVLQQCGSTPTMWQHSNFARVPPLWEYYHNVAVSPNVGVLPNCGSAPALWEDSHIVGVLPQSWRTPTLSEYSHTVGVLQY